MFVRGFYTKRLPISFQYHPNTTSKLSHNYPNTCLEHYPNAIDPRSNPTAHPTSYMTEDQTFISSGLLCMCHCHFCICISICICICICIFVLMCVLLPRPNPLSLLLLSICLSSALHQHVGSLLAEPLFLNAVLSLL